MSLMTVAQAANELGMKTATMRDWVWRRKIEVVRIGRSVRIRSEVLESLIKRGTVPPEGAGNGR